MLRYRSIHTVTYTLKVYLTIPLKYTLIHHTHSTRSNTHYKHTVNVIHPTLNAKIQIIHTVHVKVHLNTQYTFKYTLLTQLTLYTHSTCLNTNNT